MRESIEKDEVQRDILLQQCFECLVTTGLEGASIREFQNATGMNASSLYYWFIDKDEIVLDAVSYGVNKIVRELFDFAMGHIHNVHEMRDEFPKVVQKYQTQLKAVFQVVTSPKYGEKVIRISSDFNMLYDEYAQRLAKQMNIPYNKVRPLVDLFISSIIDCVIWNEWEKLSREIDTILVCLNLQLENEQMKDR